MLKPSTYEENQTKTINTNNPPASNILLSEAISLLKIRDKISGMLFLLDTDACSNFLPLRDSDTKKEETYSQFPVANDTPINVMENLENLEVDIGFGITIATFHICAIE